MLLKPIEVLASPCAIPRPYRENESARLSVHLSTESERGPFFIFGRSSMRCGCRASHSTIQNEQFDRGQKSYVRRLSNREASQVVRPSWQPALVGEPRATGALQSVRIRGKIAAVLRHQLTVQVTIATQASEGVTITVDRRERVYEKALGGDCTAVVGEGSSCD